MLSRAMFMPALAISLNVSSLELTGPRVQTILVWRKSRRVGCSDIDYLVVEKSGARPLASLSCPKKALMFDNPRRARLHRNCTNEMPPAPSWKRTVQEANGTHPSPTRLAD